jgi:hypothetical protein
MIMIALVESRSCFIIGMEEPPFTEASNHVRVEGPETRVSGAERAVSGPMKLSAGSQRVERERLDCSVGFPPISLVAMIGAHERSGEAEIATSTLAEIYVQQGLVDRALVIYRRLAQRSPGDARIATRVAELETELERQRAGGEQRPLPEPADLESPEPAAFESAPPEAAGSEPALAPPEEAAGSELAPPPPEEAAGSELAPVPEAGSRPSAPPVAADRQFLAWLEKH